ncbi:MAG: hypothetical protein FJZ62_02480 [Chlamydiae bacterium]|nr:hypothetical protein [Chlamydiota bacterium]
MILHFIRNLDKIPFGSSEAAQILKKMLPQIFPEGKWLENLEEVEERKLTKAFFFEEHYKKLFFDPQSGLLLVLGSFDHLHILYDGPYNQIKPLLFHLHSIFSFAYDSNFGFLTTKLSTTGTGLKGKFFHELNYPKLPAFVEAIPYEGGYLYQNRLSIGYLESTFIENLRNLREMIQKHVDEIKSAGSLLAQKIYDRQ